MQEVQAHPQKFSCVKHPDKISENRDKIWAKSLKMFTKSRKIWAKVWFEKMALEVIPEKVFMICVGENIRAKSCLKTFSFSGKFGEIRAKIFRTPKNSPASTPVPSTLLLLPCPTAVSVFGIPGNYGKMFVVVRYLVHEAGVKVKLIELNRVRWNCCNTW